MRYVYLDWSLSHSGETSNWQHKLWSNYITFQDLKTVKTLIKSFVIFSYYFKFWALQRALDCLSICCQSTNYNRQIYKWSEHETQYDQKGAPKQLSHARIWDARTNALPPHHLLIKSSGKPITCYFYAQWCTEGGYATINIWKFRGQIGGEISRHR